MSIVSWILLLTALCIFSTMFWQHAKIRRVARYVLTGRSSLEQFGYSREDLLSLSSRDARVSAAMLQIGENPSGEDFLKALARFMISTFDKAYRKELLEYFVLLILTTAVGTASIGRCVMAASVFIFVLCSQIPLSFLFRVKITYDFALILYLIDQWNEVDPEGCKDMMTHPETSKGFQLLYEYAVESKSICSSERSERRE